MAKSLSTILGGFIAPWVVKCSKRETVFVKDKRNTAVVVGGAAFKTFSWKTFFYSTREGRSLNRSGLSGQTNSEWRDFCVLPDCMRRSFFPFLATMSSLLSDLHRCVQRHGFAISLDWWVFSLIDACKRNSGRGNPRQLSGWRVYKSRYAKEVIYRHVLTARANCFNKHLSIMISVVRFFRRASTESKFPIFPFRNALTFFLHFLYASQND